MGSYMGAILTLYLYTWFIRKGYLSRKHPAFQDNISQSR